MLLNFLYSLIIGLILAAVFSHIWINLIQLVDYLLDYQSFFWKVRFNYVFRNSSYKTKRHLLEQLDIAKEMPENSVDIMNTAYVYAYNQKLSVKRLICIMCLTIYSSIFFNFAIILILIFFKLILITPIYILGFYAYIWAWNK